MDLFCDTSLLEASAVTCYGSKLNNPSYNQLKTLISAQSTIIIGIFTILISIYFYQENIIKIVKACL